MHIALVIYLHLKDKAVHWAAPLFGFWKVKSPLCHSQPWDNIRFWKGRLSSCHSVEEQCCPHNAALTLNLAATCSPQVAYLWPWGLMLGQKQVGLFYIAFIHVQPSDTSQSCIRDKMAKYSELVLIFVLLIRFQSPTGGCFALEKSRKALLDSAKWNTRCKLIS